MKRIGKITYELSEEEYNEIKTQIAEIQYFFDWGSDYRKDAEKATRKLEEIFEN